VSSLKNYIAKENKLVEKVEITRHCNSKAAQRHSSCSQLIFILLIHYMWLTFVPSQLTSQSRVSIRK